MSPENNLSSGDLRKNTATDRILSGNGTGSDLVEYLTEWAETYERMSASYQEDAPQWAKEINNQADYYRSLIKNPNQWSNFCREYAKAISTIVEKGDNKIIRERIDGWNQLADHIDSELETKN